MTRVRPASVRGTLYLFVGFGLLLTPVLVDTFDVGNPNRYQYEAAELTVHDNGTVDVPIQVGRADSSVACFESRPSRACMLEHGIHERGGIQYDGVSSSIMYHDYQFVYIYGEGFFEPTTTDVNDTIEYSLTHVPHTEALDIVATDSDRVSTGLREAITTGESVTSDELEGTGEIVRHDGSYYVVYLASSDVEKAERRGFVSVGQWLFALAGVGLLLRGQRLRVEASDSNEWY